MIEKNMKKKSALMHGEKSSDWPGPFNDDSEAYTEELMDQEAESVNEEFEKYDDDETLDDDLDVRFAPEKKSAEMDYSKPPKLELKDMMNEEGEVIDFSKAGSYHELIEMITREGSIKNQLGQELPAESVINLIYKLTYQDLKNYQKEDWTNITLRHKLRETVAKLILEYKKTDEFKALAGLDLSGATTIEEVLDLVDQRQKLIDAQGNYVEPETIIDNIKHGHLHLLPEPIRFKVIEINKQNNEEEMMTKQKPKTDSQQHQSFFSRLGNTFSKLKFWGK